MVGHRNSWYSQSGRRPAPPSIKHLSVLLGIPGAEVNIWDGWLIEKGEHIQVSPGLYHELVGEEPYKFVPQCESSHIQYYIHTSVGRYTRVCHAALSPSATRAALRPPAPKPAPHASSFPPSCWPDSCCPLLCVPGSSDHLPSSSIIILHLFQ